MVAVSEFGPFAPVVGYAAAIMATGGALFLMWGGKMEKWRPPDEDLPGAAQAVVLLLCGVGMVLQWYFATPVRLTWSLGAVAVLAVACVVFFLRYAGLLGTFVFIKKVPTGPHSTRDVRILGGRRLLPAAEETRRERGVDIQTLFEGSGHNPDRLWSREDRQRVKQRVLLYFILTLLLGTSALAGAGFAAQVILNGEAAARALRGPGPP